MSDDFVFKCPCCDRVVTGLPAIVFDQPAVSANLGEGDAERVARDEDACVIDNEDYFLRAVLVIPIVGESQTLEFGVWGSLSRENFERYGASKGHADRSKLGPMFSWFCNELPLYETSTIGLKSQLIPQDDGLRPLVRFHPDETHAVAADQRNGITRERAIEFAALVLPRH